MTAAVRRLRDFPELGAVVEELENPEIREILHGSYRIIYRWRRPTVLVVGVWHASRLLTEFELPSG